MYWVIAITKPVTEKNKYAPWTSVVTTFDWNFGFIRQEIETRPENWNILREKNELHIFSKFFIYLLQ
jgi:hypothetical protein